jgi:hypothetical protein
MVNTTGLLEFTSCALLNPIMVAKLGKEPQCFWADKRTLHVIPGTMPTFEAGDRVEIRGDILYILMMGSVQPCRSNSPCRCNPLNTPLRPKLSFKGQPNLGAAKTWS